MTTSVTPTLRWQVGDVTIHRVVDLNNSTTKISDMLVGATPDMLDKLPWMRPYFATADGELILSFHAFVVKTPTRVVVIDTCVGNDQQTTFEMFNNLNTPFLENFRATGLTPEDVDVVFCTHLHVDHVGWNTRLENGKWIPTFPNARYLFDKTEFASLAKNNEDRGFQANYPVNILPVMDAGLADFIEAHDYAICDEIRLLSTPGHTPGHASVLISSQGQKAVITGDMMHSPVQCALHQHPSVADADTAQGARTRRAFLDRFSKDDTMVLGTHFPPPTAGWFEPEGSGWRFAVDKKK
jgi:glyoxylase-like metal-dependent hydrolase (beta-lactamase superfamily II)